MKKQLIDVRPGEIIELNLLPPRGIPGVPSLFLMIKSERSYDAINLNTYAFVSGHTIREWCGDGNAWEAEVEVREFSLDSYLDMGGLYED